jgi:hypothetical protein
MVEASNVACPSCSAMLAGNFCAACGQRAPRPADFTLRRFAADVGAEMSGSDSRVWRTALGLFRPGVLTLAFVQYRWRDYLPPLRLYLIVSAIFFLLAWEAYFQAQAMQMGSAPPGAVPAVLRELFSDPATAGRISDWAAGLRFAGVLALGGLVALMHWGKHLPAGRHLVFAIHYYCADYAIFLLASPLLYFAPAHALLAINQGVTFAGIGWLAWWAVRADRRVYGGSLAGNLVRGFAIVGADMVISVVAGQLAVVAVMVQRM